MRNSAGTRNQQRATRLVTASQQRATMVLTDLPCRPLLFTQWCGGPKNGGPSPREIAFGLLVGWGSDSLRSEGSVRLGGSSVRSTFSGVGERFIEDWIGGVQ